MQDKGSVEVLRWNQRKQLTIASCIEKLVDKVSVTKAKVVSTSEKPRLSSVNVQQFGKIGRAISLSAEMHCKRDSSQSLRAHTAQATSDRSFAIEKASGCYIFKQREPGTEYVR